MSANKRKKSRTDKKADETQAGTEDTSAVDEGKKSLDEDVKVEKAEETPGESEQVAAKESGGAVFEPSGDDEKIVVLMTENEKLRDQMLRACAEFENYKKRRAAELERMTATAAETVISDLLPVLDDLDLLLANSSEKGELKSLLEGAQMIRQKLFTALEKQGLEAIEAEGVPFDPEVHEALMQQSTDEAEPDMVIGVQRTGYRLGGILLRPSRVIVSSQPDNKQEVE